MAPRSFRLADGREIHFTTDESDVPVYTLPDPLAGLETADDWRRIRRREILDHFTDEVYGASPTTDVQTLGLPVVGPTESALGGRARGLAFGMMKT